MTEITPFTFPTTGQPVRTLLLDGEPHFVAADVTAILGYRMASDATRWLDEDEKGTHQLRTPGGLQTLSTVSEAGLYSLILRSQVLGAREFKRWVTHDVLPAIRKTGSYSIVEPTRKDLALMVLAAEEALEAAQQRADRAEVQVLELAPAARAWDELAEGHGDYDVAQAAIILNRDRSIKTGRQRLFEFMASVGWIYRKHSRWTPYQAQVEAGRLLLKPQSHPHPETDVIIIDAPQVRITIKGLGELHKLLGGQSQLPALVSEQVAA